MPTFSELDADQRGIYTESPNNGAVLVTGPPGTGKTVVAFHRALRLSSSGKPVTLIMFNNVLSQYTSSVGVEHKITILNMHKWFDAWYRSGFNRSVPKLDKWNYDWDKIRQQIRKIEDSDTLNRLSWGHLIIDEGQDFPQSMYEALMTFINHPKLNKENASSLTVFADENQTITSTNSNISQIRMALDATVRNKRYWQLYKNYRNTKEISDFATYYQLTGRSAARTPDVSGTKPNVIFFSSHRDVAEHVTKYVENNGMVEVGILSFGKKGDVRNIFRELQELKNEKRSEFALQMYISGNAKESIHSDAKKLNFNKPPSVTVLHTKSGKGLEFDAVFVVNMHNEARNFDASAQELIKDMYVVSSRARRILFFDIVSFSATIPPATRILPEPSVGLCRFNAQTDWREQLNSMMDDIPWAETSEMSERLRIAALADSLLSLGESGCEILRTVISNTPATKALAVNLEKYFSQLELQNVIRLVTEVGYVRVEKALASHL
jgi:DNA helicase IV